MGEYVSKQLAKRGVVRFWFLQIVVILVAALLCFLVFGFNAAVSSILGGLVCFIPNAYFAYKFFKYQGARAAKQIVNGFYKGEALKIIISMCLFTVVFILYRITPLAFFGSYIAVQMTYWVSPWVIVYKQNRLESD